MYSKIINSALFVLVAISFDVYAYCDAWAPSVSTTITTVNINVPVGTKARQEIYRGPLTQPSTFPNSECSDDLSVYGYANYIAHHEPARFYSTIDGNPTYYLGATGTKYAYALIDDNTGLAYSDKGTKIPSSMDKFVPRSTTIIIYAAMDSPSDVKNMAMSLGMLNGGSIIGIGASSYYYSLHGNITQAPIYCTLLNSNLEMTLPRISVNSFSGIGFPSEQATATDNIIINCTGNMSAELKLMASETEIYNGKNAVIKVDNGDSLNSASGVGFIVNAPNNNGFILENNIYVKIAELINGQNFVPLEVEYYRYGPIKPGTMSVSAGFVIRFN